MTQQQPRVEQLVRLRFLSVKRLERREALLYDARGAYLRQTIRRAEVVARYDHAIQLVLEARELGNRLCDQLYPVNEKGTTHDHS